MRRPASILVLATLVALGALAPEAVANRARGKAARPGQVVRPARGAQPGEAGKLRGAARLRGTRQTTKTARDADRKALPEHVLGAAKSAGLAVTDGYPKDTWNGLTLEEAEVGQKGGGARRVHLLPPGLHPTRVKEARTRLAWNERRAELFDQLAAAAPRLRELGVTHVAIGGSFGSTDFAQPGDMDVIAFVDRSRAPPVRGRTTFEAFNRASGERGVHAYAHDESIFFPGGPSSLYGFTHAPANPRPASPSLGGPRGPKVGLVLIDLDDFR